MNLLNSFSVHSCALTVVTVNTNAAPSWTWYAFSKTTAPVKADFVNFSTSFLNSSNFGNTAKFGKLL